MVATVTLFVAVGLIPVSVIAFVTIRQDLHPRLARYRLVAPLDLRKVLAVTRSIGGFGNLIRKRVVRSLIAE
jgi:hypothetical protein